jgi:hypothetical protein
MKKMENKYMFPLSFDGILLLILLYLTFSDWHLYHAINTTYFIPFTIFIIVGNLWLVLFGNEVDKGALK